MYIYIQYISWLSLSSPPATSSWWLWGSDYLLLFPHFPPLGKRLAPMLASYISSNKFPCWRKVEIQPSSARHQPWKTKSNSLDCLMMSVGPLRMTPKHPMVYMQCIYGYGMICLALTIIKSQLSLKSLSTEVTTYSRISATSATFGLSGSLVTWALSHWMSGWWSSPQKYPRPLNQSSQFYS